MNGTRLPTPGEFALYKYWEVLENLENISDKDFNGIVSDLPPVLEDLAEVNPLLFKNLGWPLPISVTVKPNEHTIPNELLNFQPNANQIYKRFFTGTPKEVSIRQIFYHCPLQSDEEEMLAKFRAYCKTCCIEIPPLIEPLLLRIVYYNKRKYPNEYQEKAVDHIAVMREWRISMFPIYDTEAELRADLDSGVMYWAARDSAFRPLLIVNMGRLKKTDRFVQRFKRLMVLCFEWGLRFLMIPGKVETCAVLLDIRSVAINQLPLSALSDIVAMLTTQYPFRLDRMWIIHDSIFLQMAWGIAKAFLTEVQQQKMSFYRSGFKEVLLQTYSKCQLEEQYGGTRATCKKFYPFPLVAGSFAPERVDSKHSKKLFRHKSSSFVTQKSAATITAAAKQHSLSSPNSSCGWYAVDLLTTFGVIWEKSCRIPIMWSPKVVLFKHILGDSNEFVSGREVLLADPTAQENCRVVKLWCAAQKNSSPQGEVYAARLSSASIEYRWEEHLTSETYKVADEIAEKEIEEEAASNKDESLSSAERTSSILIPEYYNVAEPADKTAKTENLTLAPLNEEKQHEYPKNEVPSTSKKQSDKKSATGHRKGPRSFRGGRFLFRTISNCKICLTSRR